ncbi:MAG: peroxiredoxin [Nitratireductor sp.]|nr:peroxiredoxin [Nitratireductor sp.]
MTIAVGDKLPNATFKIMTDDGPGQMTTDELFAGKKVVLFAVPGAFTPTCHMNHLPGFVEHFDTIKAKGIDDIAVVSVNDVWVMNEWSKASKGKGKIHFLADGAAEFTKAAGLEIDLSVAGMGIRSKRYSMIVDDGVLKALNIEEKPGTAEISGAARILEQL